jgi:hypothetical protein
VYLDRSALAERLQDRLHVDHRGAVDRLEAVHPNARAVDRHDRHAVQTDGVRTIRGPGAEHAAEWVAQLVARVNRQHVAAGAIEPGEQHQLVAGPEVAHRRGDAGLEHDVGVRRAFVALSRRVVEVDQRGFDPTDHPHLESGRAHRTMLSGGLLWFVASSGSDSGQNGCMESEGREEQPDRAPRRGLIGSLSRGATGIVRTVAKEVAPGVVDAVDVNEVVERVDVQGVIDRLDVQGLVDRVDANALLDDLDVQALLDRVDLDALIKRVDLDAVLADIDVNALIDRIDFDRVLDRVDLDGVLGRIDVDALLARADLDQVFASIDVNALVDRLDVDRVIEKVDVDAVVRRVDFDAIVQQTEIGSIVSHSATSVLVKVIDVGREQVIGLDRFLHGWVDRLLRREPGVRCGPPLLMDPEAAGGAP